MSHRKPEGMLMSPDNPNRSGPVKNRGKTPTGSMKPVTDKTKQTGPDPDPIEVVFKTETFRKLIIWTFGPTLITLVGAISAFFYFYHQANLHMIDPTIHLTRGERYKLETKNEATQERKKLKKEIITHFDVKVREIRVEQQEQVKNIGIKLEDDQKVRLNQILHEVRKTRLDIKNNH